MKKNIIWFLLDGVRNYPTPNDPEKMGKPEVIEELAKDAVEFTQATTSATSTIMSITAMMTSIPSYYLSRNLDDIKLDKSNFESFANILENEGYNVYSVCISYEMRRDYWKTFLRPVSKKYWPKGCKEMVHWGNEPLNEIIFSMLQKGAIKEPFFLYVHYNFRRDYKCNERVSDLIKKLKEEDLYNNSIIIMNSDHGMPDIERKDHFKWLDERGLYFNRHDLIMTDDNICVPLVIKYPSCDQGRKISTTVGTIDIVPTVLDLLNIEFGPGKAYGNSFRGVSLLPLIENENIEFFRERKIRTDTRYIAQTDRMISVRGTGYKYIYYRDVPGEENEQFIDLIKDPFEKNNLIKTSDPKYISLINEYKIEYDNQEKDSILFQFEFLKRKFFKFFDTRKFKNENIKNILVVGSCNYWFMKTVLQIIEEYFQNLTQCDLLIERDNPIDYHSLNNLGYTNNIFAHHSFNAKEIKKDYLSTFNEYDLILVPLTDYMKDFDQANTKSTDGEMIMIQPQSSINIKILNDYKEIFKITRLIKAKNKIYLDYNMNFFFNPKLVIIKKYFRKVYAKSDIYKSKPSELFKDLKRIFVSD
tara:strand:+ start:27809 stop:29566 length:1758 start_codon:yes stop_codon:yes gene_type:complete